MLHFVQSVRALFDSDAFTIAHEQLQFRLPCQQYFFEFFLCHLCFSCLSSLLCFVRSRFFSTSSSSPSMALDAEITKKVHQMPSTSRGLPDAKARAKRDPGTFARLP